MSRSADSTLIMLSYQCAFCVQKCRQCEIFIIIFIYRSLVNVQFFRSFPFYLLHRYLYFESKRFTFNQIPRIFTPKKITQTINYQLWDIQVPLGFQIKFTVRSFETENGRDFLYIGTTTDSFITQGNWKVWTGLRTLNVLESMDFTTTISSVKVIFTSDYSTTKSGFWLQLQAIPR